MRRPVCVKCMKSMTCLKNDATIEEGFVKGRLPDGLPEYESGQLWAADLWGCTQCGIQVVVGFAKMPLARHFEPHYAEIVKQAQPLGRVDD